MAAYQEHIEGRRAEKDPRILLAGCGEFEGEMLLRTLERCGFAVSARGDADTAVLRILSDPPEAVIVSENFSPQLRSAFIRWVRRTPGVGHIPVVVLSQADPGGAVGDYDVGADLVVFKPVDPDLLGRKLAAVIRRSKAITAGA